MGMIRGVRVMIRYDQGNSFFHQLRQARLADWHSYVDHNFVRQLGQGTLPMTAFQDYLIQDYLFLIQYSRAWALMAFKAPDLALMRQSSEILQALLHHEMQLHVQYCQSWGLQPEALEQAIEKPANVAYTRLMLDAGQRGDALDLMTAIAPCLIGYGEIGLSLLSNPQTHMTDNPYRSWIDMYGGEEYQQVAAAGIVILDQLAEQNLTPHRKSNLEKLFGLACRLEADFWQMGLDASA